MPHVVPNPNLIRFDNIKPSDVAGSSQAVALVAAGLETEADGSWSSYASSGNVVIATKPSEPYMSTFGTPCDVAESRARRWIEEQRQRLNALEAQIGMYGPEVAVARPHAVKGRPFSGSATPELIRSLIGKNVTHVWVNGIMFERDQSGTLRRVAPPADTTTAEKIADQFGNDGACFTDDEGNSLDDVCREEMALSFGHQTHHGDERYVFSDGSALVIIGDGWGIGFTEDEADEDEAKRFAWPETFQG